MKSVAEQVTIPKLLAREITGSMMERAAKHKLAGRGHKFNEADVEDIVSDAWLDQHCEEALMAVLDKAGLEHSPENFEHAHLLIDEELRDSKDSAKVSRRITQRWIDQKKRLREISTVEPQHFKDGGEYLLEESLTCTGAVHGKDGVIQNDRCTPEQAAEEARGDMQYLSAEDKMKLEAAIQTLSTEQTAWLQAYEATKDVKGAHSAADRQKAYRLRKKAKAAFGVQETGRP